MNWRRLVAAAAAVSMTALTAAYGGETATVPGGAGTAPSGASIQDIAKQKVAEYSVLPKNFPGPTAAFQPGTGKAAAISCGNGAAICARQAQAAVDALNAMGWEAPPPVDGEFSPQTVSAFLDRAVQDKLDGVILVAVDVNGLAAATERAAKAGLIIMCVQCLSGPQWAGKVYDVTADFALQGRIAAWQVIADAGPKAKVFGFTDLGFASATNKANGLEAGITENCPECKVEILPFAAA